MGKEKIYIETFGCQMNMADTERVTAVINSSGYEITRRVEQADVVLLNTCSVRERAEQKAFSRMGEIQQSSSKRGQLFGIMGCVAQLEGKSLFERNPHLNLVIGTRAFDRLPLLIEQAQSGQRRVLDLGERQGGEPPQILSEERHSRWVAFIPIIEGCNKFCTYCIVPYSRGREQSRSASLIVKEVKKLLGDGYQEVHLIGQNVNSYRPQTEEGLEGFRGATCFSRLLRAVAATGMPRIKFTTSFPRDFHSDIVSAMDEHDNLCNWIHLPVQSGSDRILKAMRRGYSVENYLRRIDTIKNARRKYAITTDIIVGFPGESEDDFNATLGLVEKCQYHSLYIFKYSKRPDTPAEKLEDDVNKLEKNRRFKALEEIQNGIQERIFSEYVNREVSVLVEGTSARLETDLTGHTTCHQVVNFPGNKSHIGKVVSVRVTSVKSHSLYGVMSSQG